MTESKTDNTDPTLSKVQTNNLESEKINVPYLEIECAILSAEEEKDTEETSLNSLKVNFRSSETYVAKTQSGLV